MKNKLLTLIVLLSVSQFAGATIRTVSNYFNSPGQFTDLAAAITASANGDTIYIHASSTQYNGNYTINKKLTLFGAGYNGKSYQFTNLLASVATINLTKNGVITNASGSKISGLKIATLNVTSDTVANVILERCQIVNALYLTNASNLNVNTNWVIRNNIFNSTLTLSSRNNLVTNNFIREVSSLGTNIFTNNILMYNYTTTPLSTMNNTIFSNNIIYNYNTTLPVLINANQVGNTFSNNITYNFSGTLPGANNGGLNNIANTDPQYTRNFTSWLGYDSIPNYSWDLKLASPGHNAGTDGTDIGVYGGNFGPANLDGVTQLPQVKLMNIVNSSVPQNGNLNVNVVGIKRN